MNLQTDYLADLDLTEIAHFSRTWSNLALTAYEEIATYQLDLAEEFANHGLRQIEAALKLARHQDNPAEWPKIMRAWWEDANLMTRDLANAALGNQASLQASLRQQMITAQQMLAQSCQAAAPVARKTGATKRLNGHGGREPRLAA